MIQVELKPLFARLNGPARRALEDAAGIALSRGHHEITIEHLCAKLLEVPDMDWALMFGRLDVDIARVSAQTTAQLAALQSGNGGRPVFSPLLVEWIQDAWLAASVTLGEKAIRSGALLVALLGRRNFYIADAVYSDLLRGIGAERVTAEFATLTAGSRESVQEPGAATVDAGSGESPRDGDSPIQRFCEDFTAKAAADRIDPVFGRDSEIRKMVDILARRRKNNPICVGDPGVGKTAVVEGLALRIVQNDVPEFLRGVRLIGLDIGLLEAGASVKGEFERRLRGVIDEIKAATVPTILFIDEAHMLIGAGGTAGGSDAANLLKPALARGELRTIAATTWNEYRKYFEKDPALARRFQLVKLDEPDVATAVQILRGLKERYETAHGVTVRDDALVAAAELSDRYITGRQLPDKAVDLLDTAAARVKIGLDLKPAAIERLERSMEGLERERSALERDALRGFGIRDPERVGHIEEEIAGLFSEHATMVEQWGAERDAVKRVLAARKALNEQDNALSAVEPVTDGEVEATGLTAALRDAREAELLDALADLAALRGAVPLVFMEVGPEAVSQVVSEWTGVPLGKLQRDSAAVVETLATTLGERIRGQPGALELLERVLKASGSGLKDPSQPLGVFLLAGPSGVGKTETALAVADHMFGGEQALVTINMSEFQEKHTTSRLIGSPPGYVGYGEGGVLTEAVRQRPYSVVLLDEVEKAHPDVINLFYQVFDKGTLSDGQGREVDFSNTVLFLTSNLGSQILADAVGEGIDIDERVARVRPLLSEYFKPALLARMTIVPYAPLGREALVSIVKLKMARIAARVAAASHVKLIIDDAVTEAIAARCTEVETGARNVDFILKRHVLPALSDELLAMSAHGSSVKSLHLRPAGDGAEGGFVVERIEEAGSAAGRETLDADTNAAT
ncbi:type VI secretion system ATPase TssH [Paraburkholderia sediminicola]|uniref:type VI secretion system ATPase TssH n=1 Tax=Paraburkholderia sediminicola TaxID=458836 RepID=UPI0038B871D5